jgi:hypothetical protein
MLPAKPFSVTRAFLYTLIGSVGLGAVVGIVTILAGHFGWFEGRVLLTTATIAAASMCGLACGAYWATGRGRLIPAAGIVLSFLAATLVLVGMWGEINSELYWKSAASSSVFAVAFGHLALLSMARLAGWFRWSLVAAHAVILLVAGLIVAMILAEPRGEGMFRLLAVAAILDAAITLLVPIFHRLSRTEIQAADQANNYEGQGREVLAELDVEIAKLKDRLAGLEQRRRLLAS